MVYQMYRICDGMPSPKVASRSDPILVNLAVANPDHANMKNGLSFKRENVPHTHHTLDT